MKISKSEITGLIVIVLLVAIPLSVAAYSARNLEKNNEAISDSFFEGMEEMHESISSAKEFEEMAEHCPMMKNFDNHDEMHEGMEEMYESMHGMMH